MSHSKDNSIDSYTEHNSTGFKNIMTTAPLMIPNVNPGNPKDFWRVASIVFYKDEDAKINKREITLLEEFKLLGNNWDNEESIPPSKDSICYAEYIVKALEKTGQKVYHVAPGPMGEIMVDIRNDIGSKSLELLFYPNSKNKYVFLPENNQPEQGDFTFSLLPKLLNRINA